MKRELILRANFRARIDLIRLTRLFSRSASPRSRKGTTNYCRLFSRPYTMFASTFVHSHLATITRPDVHESSRSILVTRYTIPISSYADRPSVGAALPILSTYAFHPNARKSSLERDTRKRTQLQLISPVQTLINKS